MNRILTLASAFAAFICLSAYAQVPADDRVGALLEEAANLAAAGDFKAAAEKSS